MPSYNVKCQNESCKNSEQVFEIKKKMMDDYPPCPECGFTIEAVFQPVGFVLKGRGWCGTTRR
jgi:predicted nucleic acid-binding Zn ribbon protein